MPQTPTSPSMPLPDGRSHQNPQPEQAKSDSALPIDPSIAGASPTYATHNQYPPYAAPPQDMSQGYQHPGTPSLYNQPRPDWGGYGQQPGHITPGTHIFHQAPAAAAATGRPHQVGAYNACFVLSIMRHPISDRPAKPGLAFCRELRWTGC